MEKLEVKFLGTGNAVPTERRNHTGILVSFLNENILIDCGEGIQRQLRIARINPGKITRILITHWHGDHILGLPGLFQTLAMSGYNKTMKIYGPPGTGHYLALIEQIIKELRISVQVNEVFDSIIDDKYFFIQSKPMFHGTPTNAYSIVIKDRIHLEKSKIKKLKIPNSPLLGELQGGKDIFFNGKKIKFSSVSYLEKGKKITIILDTVMNPDAVRLAEKSDLLIAESTFSVRDAEKAQEYFHLTSGDAATIAKKAKVFKLILTHISERYEHKINIIEKEAKKIFKNVRIAKDFDIFRI
ncbi:ribonuclease Z [Candidatus Pacearchaeota archaeon]|nr:ribonuclease Z [Candidatus Pacearchaeota archaeon]